MKSNWYALVSKPNREAKANEDLKILGLRTFYPRNKVRTIRKYRGAPVVKWIEKSHFPRYLFVKSTKRQLSLVRRCKHVAGIVSLTVTEAQDGEATAFPTVIPDSVMAVLISGFDESGLAFSKQAASHKRFKAMQAVKFNESSALQGALARVVTDDGTDTVKVLLKVLGGEREINAPVTALEAA